VSARDDLLAKALNWFARNGVGDTSLRTLAAELGTSHRMLHYHFGSREGLLGAVVEAVERDERAALEDLLETRDPYAAGAAFWVHVADRAAIFAPLYFELAGQAMQGKPYAASLRTWLAEGWGEVLAAAYVRIGLDADRAAEMARLSLAMARGLLFDVAVTGDRSGADRAMAAFTQLVQHGELAAGYGHGRTSGRGSVGAAAGAR
jgi:AcrR family transcriptional regulator